jgi:hypothetical protein
MTSQPQTIDDEMLVAFLDGELERDQSAQIAAAIANDDMLRKRLDQLRATWDLLSELPDIKPERDLTQTTIAMVAQMSEAPNGGWWSLLRRNVMLLVVLATALSLAAGAGAGIMRSSMQQQQILDDLAMLDQYRQLTHIESADWLQKLATLESLTEAARTQYFATNAPPVPSLDADKLDWLKHVDNQRLARISENMRSFQQERPERQSTLRELGKMLTNSPPDAESSAVDYPTIVATYAAILDRIGTAQRTHLLAVTDLDERAEALNDWVQREVAFAYAKRLSVRDQRAIRYWIDQRMASYLFFAESDLQIVRELVQESNDISDEDVNRLKESLSEHAQGLLINLDDRDQLDALGLWAFEVVQPTSEELLQRFNALSLDKKSELDFLDQGEVRDRLAR